MRHKWSQTMAAVLLTLVARALTATGSDAAPAGSLASIITGQTLSCRPHLSVRPAQPSSRPNVWSAAASFTRGQAYMTP